MNAKLFGIVFFSSSSTAELMVIQGGGGPRGQYTILLPSVVKGEEEGRYLMSSRGSPRLFNLSLVRGDAEITTEGEEAPTAS